jgi:hypothetical protein
MMYEIHNQVNVLMLIFLLFYPNEKDHYNHFLMYKLIQHLNLYHYQ